MNVYEYQAKNIIKDYGIPVLENGLARSADEAVAIAERIGGSSWAVKAQIHAGGRGKSGGIKIVQSLDELHSFANELLGTRLITKQTSSNGEEVLSLLVEEGLTYVDEFYCSIVLDRVTSKVVFVASREGGVEIEKVAKDTPEKILRMEIDPVIGLSPFIGRSLSFRLGLEGKAQKKLAKIFAGLYKLFFEKDCTMIEINPLVVTSNEEVLALDVKINFDDNSLFRHPDLLELKDESSEGKLEAEAKKHGLSYIRLQGDIGCLVNGAGLAMATMDVIQLKGGEPANFLDVGGTASQEAVEKAFTIILNDSAVKVIFVNIIGGIIKCDIIANGIVAALTKSELAIPLVVRLEGTNVVLGKKILKDSNIEIIFTDNLEDAAQKVVTLVNGNEIVESGDKINGNPD